MAVFTRRRAVGLGTVALALPSSLRAQAAWPGTVSNCRASARAGFAHYVADEHAFWGAKLKALKIDME